MANRKTEPKADDVQSQAVLTGHGTKSGVVIDPVTGKTQAVHTTDVITDPNDPLAVQGHDDPRVNGGYDDPLRQDPSPNDIADGAEIPAEAAASHVQVGDASDEDHAAGAVATTSDQVADDDDKPDEKD